MTALQRGNATLQHRTEQHSTARYGTAWHGTAPCGTAAKGHLTTCQGEYLLRALSCFIIHALTLNCHQMQRRLRVMTLEQLSHGMVPGGSGKM